MKLERVTVLFLGFGLAACRGKVAGTATLAGPGSVTTHIVATGPIQVWADTMGDQNTDCEISLNCAFPSLTGDIEVKVTGRTGPNVKAVKKMSLNFRSQ